MLLSLQKDWSQGEPKISAEMDEPAAWSYQEFFFPTGQDASPSQGYPQPHLYTWVKGDKMEQSF